MTFFLPFWLISEVQYKQTAPDVFINSPIFLQQNITDRGAFINYEKNYKYKMTRFVFRGVIPSVEPSTGFHLLTGFYTCLNHKASNFLNHSFTL